MRKSFLVVAMGMAALASTGVQAQGYVGAAAGWSRLNVDCSGVTSCDKTSTGGKLYGGYKFGGAWSVEASYFDWGKASGEGEVDSSELAGLAGRKVALDGVSPPTTASLRLRSTGFGLGAAYTMPIGSNWTAVARLGVAHNRGKLDATLGAGSGSSSTRSTQPYLGVGVGYSLTSNLSITGEADFSRVKYGADGVTDTDRVQLLSLGLRYTF